MSSGKSSPAPVLFLKKFFKHRKQVASVAPSSKSLARELCRYIDSTEPQIVVELGAGTGAVTTVAAQKLHPSSRLIAVELDHDFGKVLQKRCPRAEVIVCDVKDLDEQLAAKGIESVDLFLSGLPIPSMPSDVNTAVFDCFKKYTKPETYFSQLTVMPYLFKGIYERIFSEVIYKMVFVNIPPGGVYHCRNVRENYEQDLPNKR